MELRATAHIIKDRELPLHFVTPSYNAEQPGITHPFESADQQNLHPQQWSTTRAHADSLITEHQHTCLTRHNPV